MPREYLVISIRPEYNKDTYFKPIMPRLNEWFGEWFEKILIEDYDDLELSTTSFGFDLRIHVNQLQPTIVEELRMGIIDAWKRGIRDDEFEIIDCHMPWF